MFSSREEAAILLSKKIAKERGIKNAIIVAIPRGGIIIGKIISSILQFPLFALIVKKIVLPANPELAIGAAGSDGTVYWDNDILASLSVSDEERQKLFNDTLRVIRQKEKSLGLKKLEVHGRDVIVVDDGVATGATAVAASLTLKKMNAEKIILATPVIAKRTKKEIAIHFNKIVSVMSPRDFSAVGQFYREFPQVEDEEVKELLSSSTIGKNP